MSGISRMMNTGHAGYRDTHDRVQCRSQGRPRLAKGGGDRARVTWDRLRQADFMLNGIK